MNIKISHSWLLEYLKTKASPTKIAHYLSLSGPSVEKLEKVGKDWIYDIEVTTNRVDSMSVYGIAREAAAILPQFGINANLQPLKLRKPVTPKKSLPFKVVMKSDLVGRAIAVVLEDITNWQPPDWLKTRLENADIRSLNSVVDITNYVMLELGHPSHAFDYDKIKNHKFIIRQSDKGEKVTSFDNKTYDLAGGDIVFDDGEGIIIDLPGIIGTKNSVVSKNTKRVLFFVDNNNPTKIRKTSMGLGIRTNAAIINEKGIDPELGMATILRGIELYQKICGAQIASRIYDFYFKKPKIKTIQLTKQFIDNKLGVSINKSQITKILNSLEIQAKWTGNKLVVKPPSFRANDIFIPEDIVEEVARIYGYHNLPSKLMSGALPQTPADNTFSLEMKIKRALKSLGAMEVYTSSLVSKEMTDARSFKLKNPLGEESRFLRTKLLLSLVKAAKDNSGESGPFHLFEIANVYLPRKNNLPEERLILAGIFANCEYRRAKGTIECLLDMLNIKPNFSQKDYDKFLLNQSVSIKVGQESLGKLGILKKNLIYYEFEITALAKAYSPIASYKPLPKYPAQIEDITFKMPEKTKIGHLISSITLIDQTIKTVELKDIYKNFYTFTIKYQHPQKTLTNAEVEKIRKKVIKQVKQKFGGVIKD